MQDGYKRPLLCGDCEERFSAFETATARQVFRPIVEDSAAPTRYDGSFVRFLISVLWRNLAVDIDEGINDIVPEFHKVEESWRRFLLDEQPLTAYDRVHVFVAGIPSSGPAGHSVYLSRDADFTVVTRGSLPIAVYAKSTRMRFMEQRTMRFGNGRSINSGTELESSRPRASSNASPGYFSSTYHSPFFIW